MAAIIRIDIQAHGPYVVHGDAPLTELAQVQTFNGEPIDWHQLGEIEAPAGAYELCRCGQSSTKPFCDNSHEAISFDGTETADRRPFAERATVEAGATGSLADDQSLCISAGFCGTRTTNVWKLLGENDDPAAYELMKEMVWRCPSGRIVLRDDDGNDVEPDLKQEIAVLPGGPLWIRGGVQITGADGEQWETRNRVLLCRCGESSSQPFCDGSHSTAHFDER